MSVYEALRAINAYPIPDSTIKSYAIVRLVDTNAELTQDIATSKAFELLRADLQMWLAAAPSISQAGITYTFSDSERSTLKKEASLLYQKHNEIKTTYGSIGEWL